MAQGINIFLADDDLDDCYVFQEVLNDLNSTCDLTIANDGQELLRLLKDGRLHLPDLIFLDLNMPIVNGYECLVEIRQKELLKHIPVIILSTSSNEKEINKLYDGGADYYVCKPPSFSSLRSMLKKIISVEWHDHRSALSIDSFIMMS